MAIPHETAWLNGEFLPLQEARISPLDRGFLFGDGIYEVVPIYDGQPFELEAHLDRLEYSLGEIRLRNPLSRAQWRSMIAELVERNGGGDQTVYFQITRGADSQRDHGFPDPDLAPTCFAMSSPLAPAPARFASDGARAHLVEDIRWRRCDIKATGLLANAMAKQAARDAGADEALLHRDGQLIEGSSMTLFLVENGALLTPPKGPSILPGITRDVVINLARDLGVAVEEAPLAMTRLQSCDELWFTSSSREIMPVTQVDGITIGDGRPGPVWQRFQQTLSERTRVQSSTVKVS
ncbi:D-amino acid aminotransferase [Natronospira bacteriovora]|uniref:branched-chain-amino-acid transaminase n=1 Tax=Natronospira bacteriovora TaxID=3069753 RepID=A0ABU0W417_9GAMM|nr:D-amino acid aminotransferase [Natronospira sp. AB-CW4]MDQ2068763.1 D-amino acid aminotransferase [Natronospira sp. AB-CW4]